MKLLVIDTVNYIDYPTGGVLAFYRSMLPPCGNNLILVGTTTDDDTPIRMWVKRKFYGIEFDFFSMKRVVPSASKPLVPGRISDVLLLKSSLHKVLSTAPAYDYIFTQSHEVLHCLPNNLMEKTCFVSAGLTNPLSISRYSWARVLAKIYDKYYLMPKVAKVRWHLAAADQKSKEDFARRSGGLVDVESIISFPTRFNDKYFRIMSIGECRATLSISPETKVFVTVGRLNWFKGWQLMIDAFKLYEQKHSDSLLFFIGDGEDESKIRIYVSEKSLNEKVVLAGKKNQKEIAEYLNAANVFVMGSFAEGWSTTLVEASACGVPCVVTEFSSAKEMITDGENGFVVCNREPKTFAENMEKATQLERESVQKYNQRFEKLAQSKIMEEIERILG